MENGMKAAVKTVQVKAPKPGENLEYTVNPGEGISLEGISLEGASISVQGDTVEITLATGEKITLADAVDASIQGAGGEVIQLTDLVKASVSQEDQEPAAGPQRASSGLRMANMLSAEAATDDNFAVETRQDRLMAVDNEVDMQSSPFIFSSLGSSQVETGEELIVIQQEKIAIEEIIEPIVTPTPALNSVVEETVAEAQEVPAEPLYNQINGTDGDDKLKGTEDADILSGGGGRDKLDGKGGDDILIYDAIDKSIEGGEGQDTLRIIDNSDISLDKGKVIEEIEVVDMDNGLANTIILTEKDVLKVADDEILQILGDALDSVDAPDFTDRGADIDINGVTFATFTSGDAQIYVELGITLNEQVLIEF